MYLRVPSQKVILDLLISLGESDLKLSAVDEGSFMCWLGQGDRYKLLPARKNNIWNAYDIPTWLYIDVKSSFISA